MADETSICNLALARLSETAVMSLDDETQAARYCKRFYAQTRDAVLQSHAWNFALARVLLTRLAEEPASGWAHQYALPVDCLRILQVNGYEWHQRQGLFETEGRALLTDAEVANVRYIRQVTDATLFTPLFIEALAVKLASQLAQPLTGSRELPTQLLTEYERIIGPKARRLDAFEGKPKAKLPWVTSALVAARRSG